MTSWGAGGLRNVLPPKARPNRLQTRQGEKTARWCTVTYIEGESSQPNAVSSDLARFAPIANNDYFEYHIPMVIGVPKEIKPQEHRVALTPEGARELVREGHTVLCEASLGEGSGFRDMDYIAAGASIVPKEAVFADAALVIKVKEPIPEEFPFLRPGLALFTFLHLAANTALTDTLMRGRITALAYETLTRGGRFPLLMPMSEIAGRMAPIMGAHYIQRTYGGSGLLPSGVPGVAPAGMLVLGSGVVGSNAARVAVGLGMDVTVLGQDIAQLREIDREHCFRVKTRVFSDEALEECLALADVVVGAVLVNGERAPVLVRRSMLTLMRRGAVVVDVSIDQGGCFESSHPTTHADPVFVDSGVVHYCVANMPGAYPHTSTLALTHATLPYIRALASKGIEVAMKKDAELRSALNAYDGMIAHRGLAESTGLPFTEF